MRIQEVIVVEGKDDVAAVKAAVDAQCLTTHGHGLNARILQEIEEAAERCGIIILTDPDYAGKRIRQLLAERIPQAKHAYLDRVSATKGDDIGVENASPEVIREALQRARATLCEERHVFSADDLFAHGLDGAEGAKARRIALAGKLGISYGNAKQLLARLNDFGVTRNEFESAMQLIHHERGEAFDGAEDTSDVQNERRERADREEENGR